jgi:uncharacterized cupin superfamily protein
VSATSNIYADDWDEAFLDIEGWCSHVRRLVTVPGTALGLALFELLPGRTQSPYHFHYGAEEQLIVLTGRPTLRTPAGDRELDEGEVVHFPSGSGGAHQVVNRSAEPVRYLIASTNVSPEIVEYPDSRKVLAMARGASPLRTIHRLDEGVDYLDGEEPQR